MNPFDRVRETLKLCRLKPNKAGELILKCVRDAENDIAMAMEGAAKDVIAERDLFKTALEDVAHGKGTKDGITVFLTGDEMKKRAALALGMEIR